MKKSSTWEEIGDFERNDDIMPVTPAIQTVSRNTRIVDRSDLPCPLPPVFPIDVRIHRVGGPSIVSQLERNHAPIVYPTRFRSRTLAGGILRREKVDPRSRFAFRLPVIYALDGAIT